MKNKKVYIALIIIFLGFFFLMVYLFGIDELKRRNQELTILVGKRTVWQYQDKKWLDWAAIIEFSLSDEDIKRITQRQVIDNLDNVVDSLLYVIKRKYVNDDKFGIIPNKKTTLLLKKLLKL